MNKTIRIIATLISIYGLLVSLGNVFAGGWGTDDGTGWGSTNYDNFIFFFVSVPLFVTSVILLMSMHQMLPIARAKKWGLMIVQLFFSVTFIAVGIVGPFGYSNKDPLLWSVVYSCLVAVGTAWGLFFRQQSVPRPPKQ